MDVIQLRDLVLSRFLLCLHTPFYSRASILCSCANVSIPSSHCHTGQNPPRHIILAHFIVRGDRECKYPGDMSAILIYERLANVDGIRMTLCGIPFTHDYLPGHRSHAVIVTFNKSTCTILCCLVTAQVRGGFQ